MKRRKLIIHDMSEQEWNLKASEYEGYDVIRDNGTIRPCIGCFTCWTRTPGRCVIKDGYDQMGARINAAEELVINSRFTYGGFSAFIKNVFDRSLGYVMPYFEVYDHEMHHKRRYAEVKNVTFIFRGHDLTEEDKEKARRYVTAVCRNIQGNVKQVLFEEEDEEKTIQDCQTVPVKDRVLLVNCSLRGKKANSRIFLDKMIPFMSVPFEQCSITDNEDELYGRLLEAETLVLAMPLYVDGLSSTVIRLFNRLEKLGRQDHKNIYILSNMGLYESGQLVNLLDMVRYWCREMNYNYCGSVAIGAGEMVGVLLPRMNNGPVRDVTRGLRQLAEAVSRKETMTDTYIQPFMFPRSLYIWIANRSWDSKAYRLKMKPSDLYRQLEVEE